VRETIIKLQAALHNGSDKAALQPLAAQLQDEIKSMLASLQLKAPATAIAGNAEASNEGAKAAVLTVAVQSVSSKPYQSKSETASSALQATKLPIAGVTAESSAKSGASALEQLSMRPVYTIAAQQAAQQAGSSTASTASSTELPLMDAEQRDGLSQGTMQAVKLTGETPVKVETINVPIQRFAGEMSHMMLKTFKITSLDGVTEAKINLFPEHLGQVQVKLTMSNGQLVAQFLTETLAGKEAIESQLSQLRA